MRREAVVDTDVCSFVFKKNPLGQTYTKIVAEVIPVISFMTLAELNHWAALYKWGDVRRAHLEAYVFQLAVIESSPALCQRWAEVTLAARKAGRPIACADAWIAATALEIDCPLITHNAREYALVSGLDFRSAAE